MRDSTRVGGASPLPRPRRALFVAGCLAVAVAAWLVVFRVDLSPKVEGDFFFATDDPQLQESRRIAALFPAREQLLLSASGPDLSDPKYLERLEALTTDLEAVDGVDSVQSLVRGPGAPQQVASSPLWSRLLLGSNPNSSQLLVQLSDPEEAAADDSGIDGSGIDDSGIGDSGIDKSRIEAAPTSRQIVENIEEIVGRRHAPSFALALSGVPYVVEQIRRALGRDLEVFSTASLLVFGLVIALVHRSFRLVAGTLLCCLGACALTLAILHGLDKPIGLLTANLVTIVFVLTLSHLVFLTANWSQERDAETAVRQTFGASAWCAVTTLLGFASLLFASAQPLRELGVAGAVGTAVALAVAYAIYPAVLHGARRPTIDEGDEDESEGDSAGDHRKDRSKDRSKDPGDERLPAMLRLRQGALATALLALAAVAALGLPRLDTDPNLLSYFAEGSELRRGLERIDKDGGSSPLTLVVRLPDGGRLDDRGAQERMRTLQESLDQDPAVGTVLSLPLLLAEASQVPFASFLSIEKIVDLLASERFDHIALGFLTEDRTRALYFLRMHEAEKTEPRREVIERIRGQVAAAELEAEMVGGLYELQASLGELVASSVLRGLGGLLLLFVAIAWIVARRPATAAAMIVSLAAVPVLLLGAFGLLALPLDIISSPAANVAIALGIDSMIHLVTAVRRRREANGGDASEAWNWARRRLWPAIAGATAILAAGFGIFVLSSFPPTARFGLAIAGGTIAAAAMALVTLPVLARLFERTP